ncbi:MAG: Lysine-specific demethylase 8 [Marteilia pararefringens]
MSINLETLRQSTDFLKLKEFAENNKDNFQHYSDAYLQSVVDFIEVIEKHDEITLARAQELIKDCDYSIIMNAHRKNDIFNVLISKLCDLLPRRELTVNYDLQKIVKINLDHYIDCRRNLTLYEFINEFLECNLPVKISGCEQQNNIGFNELLSNHYMRQFPVEIGSKYTDDDWRQEIMSFGEFFDTYFARDAPNKGYIAQFNIFQTISHLISKFNIPEYALVRDGEVDVNIWIGPQKTISPTHFDLKNNILTQIVGAKHIILFDPKLHDFPLAKGFTNTADIDVKQVQSADYTKCKSIMLLPGQMLFIPKGWWHYCVSMTSSVSISCWF